MIDKRYKKEFLVDRDPRLESISDTDLILEYSKTLNDIYPHLIKIYAHCYDPYDEVVMNLFCNMIYSAFSVKYGIAIKYNETHTYGFTLHRFHKINHIVAFPKSLPIECIVNNESLYLNSNDLKNKELIFIQFGDTKNCLTGGEDEIDLKTVNFHYSELYIVDKDSGLRFKNSSPVWIKNELIEFSLVVEDYDSEEHKYYKEIYAD
ncbi:MAG: hypothetical protein ACM3P1_10605 [Candidatus Saccharibacteria bacterium]